MSRLNIKDIRKGDVFIEDLGYGIATARALEDGHEVSEATRSGFECKAQLLDGNGEPINHVATYFEDPRYSAYAPRLYTPDELP